MALEKVIKVSVDQIQASGGLEKFTENLKKTEAQSVSLKAELKKLKDQLAELPEGTKEYNEILKKAGEVGDKIADINTKVKNIGSDTRGIDAVVQGAQTLSGAFSVATSASALFGEENKDLQQTMLKVEAAIGMVVGVQSIANALQKESALSIGLNTVATKAQTIVQMLYTTAVGTTTGALKALKIALISSGIGAFVVLVGYLISKISEAADKTDEMADAQDNFNKSIEQSNRLISKNLELLDARKNQAILQAKIAGASEEELNKIQEKFANERVRIAQKEYDKRADLAKNFREKTISILKEGTEEEIEYVKKTQQVLDDNKEKAKQEFYNSKQEEITAELNSQLYIAEKTRENQEKARQDAIKAAEQRRKDLEEQRKKELEEYQNFLYLINKADDEQRLLKTEQRLAQDEEDLARLQQIADEQTAIENAQLEAEKNIAAAKMLLKQQELEANKAHVQQLGGVLEGFSDLVGKQTALGKTMAVAAATINTFKGVSEVWGAKSMGNPVVDMAVKIASTALVVASGIANVKKILSVKVPNSGGGGGAPSISGVSAPTVPSFNIVEQNSNNQLARTIATQQQQPVEAYVVSGNVTNQQSLDRNRQQTATFN